MKVLKTLWGWLQVKALMLWNVLILLKCTTAAALIDRFRKFLRKLRSTALNTEISGKQTVKCLFLQNLMCDVTYKHFLLFLKLSHRESHLARIKFIFSENLIKEVWLFAKIETLYRNYAISLCSFEKTVPRSMYPNCSMLLCSVAYERSLLPSYLLLKPLRPIIFTSAA